MVHCRQIWRNIGIPKHRRCWFAIVIRKKGKTMIDDNYRLGAVFSLKIGEKFIDCSSFVNCWKWSIRSHLESPTRKQVWRNFSRVELNREIVGPRTQALCFPRIVREGPSPSPLEVHTRCFIARVYSIIKWTNIRLFFAGLQLLWYIR